MTPARALDVAIAGATGVVGRTFLDVMRQRDFPVRSLRAMASERSVGRRTMKVWGVDKWKLLYFWGFIC